MLLSNHAHPFLGVWVADTFPYLRALSPHNQAKFLPGRPKELSSSNWTERNEKQPLFAVIKIPHRSPDLKWMLRESDEWREREERALKPRKNSCLSGMTF